jgi:glucan phosphoethanolaminetransferase (alkaline phosphatase superfamily)
MNFFPTRSHLSSPSRTAVADRWSVPAASFSSRGRPRKSVESVWSAANGALLALPIAAILLHLYSADLKAIVTVGLRAAIVSKIATVFEHAIYTVLSCIIVGTVALLRMFQKSRVFGIILWPALAILLISILLDNKMGTVGADSLAEILCTNWWEATSYGLQALSTMSISLKELAVALSPAAFYGCLALFGRFSKLRPKFAFAMISLTLSAGALVVLFSRDMFRLFSACRDTHLIQQQLAKATSAELNHFVRLSGPRLVVYIGESTNRELYQALAGTIATRQFKDNVLLFDQVISPHSHTSPSLLRELTVSDDPSGDQLKYDTELWRANLISVLNRTGIGADWYSNQSQNEWPAELFGKEANRQYFQKQGWGSSFTGYHRPDSELLAYFLGAFQTSERSALFFHSYAGHVPYCDNLPAGFSALSSDLRTKLAFKGTFGDLPILNQHRHLREINCYDRALAYIAGNLDSVMQAMWAVSEPIVLVYFSDHGEDVLDGTGHESGNPSHRKIEVPLIVFFNAAARRKYGREFEAARANRTIRYSLGWISDSLADIAGLTYKRDFISIFRHLGHTPDRYSSLRMYRGKRYVIAVDGNHDAQGLAALTDIDLYEKRRLIHSLPDSLQERICAHRADSWMKFRDASEVFPCLEIDLVLDAAAQQVYVFHPPKANNGLTLRDLVSYAPGSWSKLWLDTKNLNKSNAGFYLQYLNELFTPAQRAGILIETSLNTSDDSVLRGMLAEFRNSGYGLSYYLPTDDGIRCSQTPEAAGCAAFVDQVLATISNLPYSSLSFDIRAQILAQSVKRQHKIQLNTWDTNVKQRSDLDLDLLNEVSMYLVPYCSRFDY